MSHDIHEGHAHKHGADCGHVAVQHGDHVGYLHDGHLHCAHDDHYDEHIIAVSNDNPANCDTHDCTSHDAGHDHGADCGHPAVNHGDHVDYLVDGHLHHHHDGHCDDHGRLNVA